jgi:RNA polymerase sigma-70 factor (ECF subfamily)
MDDALLVRIADRDSRALADLYDRHANLLFTLIVRILGDRAEAEDALHDVFLRIWQRADIYNPVFGAPAAWLVRLARDRAIDRLRRRGGSPITERATEAADPGAAPPPTRAAAAGRHDAIAGAMSVLPPEERQLIECAFFEGYSQAELSEKFALPLGTVKTRIRRGMQTLREQLQQIHES